METNTNQKLLLASTGGSALTALGLLTPGFDMAGFLILLSLAVLPLIGIAFNLLGDEQ